MARFPSRSVACGALDSGAGAGDVTACHDGTQRDDGCPPTRTRSRAPPGRWQPLPLTTPLVWAWGGVLLTASTWLVGVIALVRSVGGLFD
ncbi:hypothetical protein ACFQY5_01180 [Paeniroseomonas aquatica]|uniref:hypothetical protein n=1 Tax=Paeniroseomonas aquatica TaxID=373043 RepID=UPI0036086D9F